MHSLWHTTKQINRYVTPYASTTRIAIGWLYWKAPHSCCFFAQQTFHAALACKASAGVGAAATAAVGHQRCFRSRTIWPAACEQQGEQGV